MTPFANATTPVKAALGTALALAACVLFLLVASNVLLLGLRLHDGGLHWSEIVTGWPRYGADPRFDRWLTLATLAGVLWFWNAGCCAPSPSAASSRQRPLCLRARDQGRGLAFH